MIPLKDYIVEAFMNTKIYEMADDRSRFASKIDNLLNQIIENLALIFYNIENDKRKYTKHWLDELTAHIDVLRSRKLKLSKKRIFYDVIDAVNLTDASQIKYIIHNKFDKESYNTKDLSQQGYDNIIYFINNELSEICCSKYKTNNKFTETKEDIIEVIRVWYLDIYDFLEYKY